MGLFTSKSEREAREKVAIQMGRNNVVRYVTQCRSHGQRYLEMARKALALGQRKQGEQYVATHLQYQRQGDKWEAFILKIDDIVLRGNAMAAMNGLMTGISHLCQNISRGLSTADIEKTMVQLQTGMAKVDMAESHLSTMLSDLKVNAGPEGMEVSAEQLEPELQQEVSGICDSLQSGLKARVPAAGPEEVRAAPGRSAPVEEDFQARVNSQLERLRKLRERK